MSQTSIEPYQPIYTTVIHSVRKKLSLTHSAYYIVDSISIIELITEGKYEGWFIGANSYFEQVFDVSRRTVINSLNCLREKGLVEEAADGNQRLLRSSPLWKREKALGKMAIKKGGAKIAHHGGAELAPEGVQKLHIGGAKIAPNNNIYIDRYNVSRAHTREETPPFQVKTEYQTPEELANIPPSQLGAEHLKQNLRVIPWFEYDKNSPHDFSMGDFQAYCRKNLSEAVSKTDPESLVETSLKMSLGYHLNGVAIMQRYDIDDEELFDQLAQCADHYVNKQRVKTGFANGELFRHISSQRPEALKRYFEKTWAPNMKK